MEVQKRQNEIDLLERMKGKAKMMKERLQKSGDWTDSMHDKWSFHLQMIEAEIDSIILMEDLEHENNE